MISTARHMNSVSSYCCFYPSEPLGIRYYTAHNATLCDLKQGVFCSYAEIQQNIENLTCNISFSTTELELLTVAIVAEREKVS